MYPSEIQKDVFLRNNISKSSCTSNEIEAKCQNKGFSGIFSMEGLVFLRNEFHKIEYFIIAVNVKPVIWRGWQTD